MDILSPADTFFVTTTHNSFWNVLKTQFGVHECSNLEEKGKKIVFKNNIIFISFLNTSQYVLKWY